MIGVDAGCASMRRVLILACSIAAAGPARALEPEVLQRYGGTYSMQCADASSPRLRITADALLVERGARRLVGPKPQAAYSYFGQSPPPGYEVALQSQERGAPELTFVVFRDRGGLYLQFDAEPRVMAALGRPPANTKYRDCDAARNQREGAAAGRQALQDAKEAAALAAASPLADARFKAAYHAALGARVKEHWLARLDGPAPEPRRLRVAGDEYVLHAVCKAHDCHDNNLVLLYSPARGVAYGTVFERGTTSTLIGAPPPAIATELERLWRRQWRQSG
jgi:hypothetical protein